ncbi:MAG: EthD domain-containing protein, partial [Hyphomicrobiales bacterium]|nr:EthD domain-containing protein [Hyphomicrobiales bacterium]
IWYDNIDGFLEYLQSSNYNDVIRPDEERFTDPRRVQFMFSEETPIIG